MRRCFVLTRSRDVAEHCRMLFAVASTGRGKYMHGNIPYKFTSGRGSDADDGDGQWLVFAAVALLTTAILLCAAGAIIDPGLRLWPEPIFVGP